MSIEHVWYALVGVYFFWLTAVAVVVTVGAVSLYRSLSRLLVSRPQHTATKPRR